MEAADLVRLVESATKEQLEELRKEIGARKAKLRALLRLESVLAAALGQTPQKRPKKPAADSDIHEQRRRVALYLAGGARNGQDIITECRIAPVRLGTVMSCDFFAKTGQGWHLTTVGRKEFL